MLWLLGDTPAADFDGCGRLPLTRRHAETLALLASRTHGWGADELAYRLHGEDGAAASITTELHRIRGVLGKVVEPNPYRFCGSVCVISDASIVAGHLRTARATAALAANLAKLLNRSVNLAIKLIRDELSEAVGASVKASGYAGLMRWCSSDMGSSDSIGATVLGKLTGPGRQIQLVRARMDRTDGELCA